MTVKQRISFHAAQPGDLIELVDTATGETHRVEVAGLEEVEQHYTEGRWPLSFSDKVIVADDNRRFVQTRALLPGEAGHGSPYTETYRTWLLLPNEEALLRWSIKEVRLGADHWEGHPDDLGSYAEALKRVTDFAEASLAS